MKFYFLLLLVFVAFTSYGQNKKVISFDEMLSWNSIQSSIISNDGTVVVYQAGPLIGDPMVIVYDTKTEKADTLLITSGAVLSPDGSFLIATKKVPFQELRQAKLDEVKKDDMPKDSTLIYNLNTQELIILPKSDSTLISRKEGYLAAVLFKKEKEKDEPVDTSIAEVEVVPEETESDSISKPKELGKQLVIYNGNTGDSVHVRSVLEFAISEKGNQLAYIDAFKLDSVTTTSCKLWDEKNNSFTNVLTTEGKIKKLAFSEDGRQLAFLMSDDTTKVKNYSIYYSENKEPARLAVQANSTGLFDGWGVSDHGKISFSSNGEKLYFGTAILNEEEPKDTLTDDEKPKLDLWSWTDIKLQPQQLAELSKEKKRNYIAVWNIELNKVVQVENEVFKNSRTTPKKDTDFVLRSNGSPYLRESNWTGLWKEDLEIVNINTGAITEVAKAQFRYRLSKAGNFVVWFSDVDSCFHSFSVETGNLANISKNIPQKIYDEQEDHPIIPSNYGIAGWTPNDDYLLIYDRFDIWKVDPMGIEAPANISNGFGRSNQIQLRIVDLDPENDFIDLTQTLLLKGVNEETNAAAFYEFKVAKKNGLKELLAGDYRFSTPKKARNADVILWTKQNFELFPDLVVSDSKFKKAKTISNLNPQQEQYNWGTVEPYSWKSFRGETLKGLIYKPENFDNSKKYPMIVYYYERSFDRQHTHRIPSPSRSTINPTFYASNGYLVFIPDITYVDGYPGQSAYDCVISGVQSLTTQFSWIDEEHMGLQGQSWGGYQTAYLVTQTDLFAAAMGGAVVSNMTSAYGGIRWKSGLNRMFQYEKTQSRIGGTLWDMPMQYIQNSPLFHAPKVNTPILLMHNDKDGAVPWYQGIEFFVALRRLNKPVWMLNYNGQPHNLSAGATADRLDLSKRMKQFFDHYLKDEPAPAWMINGIPAIEKGKNLGY